MMAGLSEGCVVTYAAPTLRRFLQEEDSRREDLLLVTKCGGGCQLWPCQLPASAALPAARHAMHAALSALHSQRRNPEPQPSFIRSVLVATAEERDIRGKLGGHRDGQRAAAQKLEGAAPSLS